MELAGHYCIIPSSSTWMNGSFGGRGLRMAYFSPAQVFLGLSYLRFWNGVWIIMASD